VKGIGEDAVFGFEFAGDGIPGRGRSRPAPAVVTELGLGLPLPGPLYAPAIQSAFGARSPQVLETEALPADWPAIVTLRGSPPTASMLDGTQRMAACWSSSARLPDERSSDSAVRTGKAR
jgi:hypothetical protein